MSARCCAPPHVKIIKVGDVRAGIVGLDQLLTNVRASGLSDENEIQSALLAEARKHGNYITPAMEDIYKEAFIREYTTFCRKRIVTKQKNTRGNI